MVADFLEHDAGGFIFLLCRGRVTLLAISNLVTISEKNTTKDNQKKISLDEDDEKKEDFSVQI